ncbi:Uncharacterised protein [Mycobacteroides abscessus subsp. abscessus]|nr:Uncharacterised protein [Mycobacteroides abscessus subsp. abscessus]
MAIPAERSNLRNSPLMLVLAVGSRVMRLIFSKERSTQ